MLPCRSKGTLDHDREMQFDVDVEGSNTYPNSLKGEDEVQFNSIMKS